MTISTDVLKDIEFGRKLAQGPCKPFVEVDSPIGDHRMTENGFSSSNIARYDWYRKMMLSQKMDPMEMNRRMQDGQRVKNILLKRTITVHDRKIVRRLKLVVR